MKEELTPGQVKKEIHARIEEEIKKSNATDLRGLIYEKPWCTGGKGEEVDILKLGQKNTQ